MSSALFSSVRSDSLVQGRGSPIKCMPPNFIAVPFPFVCEAYSTRLPYRRKRGHASEIQCIIRARNGKSEGRRQFGAEDTQMKHRVRAISFAVLLAVVLCVSRPSSAQQS